MSSETRPAPFRAGLPKRLWALAALVVVVAPLLGSSVAFCETPNIYTSAQDLSHDFSNRWSRGRGADASLWTPDGSRIVFSHAGRIYAVDADGTELTSLSGSYEPAHLYSHTAEIDFSLTLSPDGERVAYATLRYAQGELREHTYEIAVQNIDGADRVRLTENDRDDIAPSWSPDGSLIAFFAPGARGAGYRVFAMSPDGSGERELAPSLAAVCCDMAWSPDGARLAFAAERRETAPLEWVEISGVSDPPKRELKTIPDYAFRRQSIHVAKADGSGVVELAWAGTQTSPPATRVGISELRYPEEGVSWFQWSPDGARIAFVARRYGERYGIYVADAEGADVRRIFNLSTVSELDDPDSSEFISEIAWSPDGSRLDFETYLFRLNIDGSSYTGGAYSVSADGSDLRQPVEKPPGYYLELSEKIKTGDAPKRIVRYADDLNTPQEMEGWVLSAAAWGESDETVLARVVNNRVVAANPRIAQVSDAGAECDKAVPAGWRGGLMKDCRALLEMRAALAGGGVLYWSADSPITEWPGIAVEDGRVIALESVPGVQLGGIIPPQIAELTELRTLNLEGNELSGELPPELGNLSKLEVLDIGDWRAGHNHIAGRVPPELGNLSNLRILDLSGNGLEGEIPAELGGLQNLEELYLQSNPFHGEIPPELGNLSNLRALYLGGGGSRLSGEIPPELGKLDNLQELSTAFAPLTGGIPPELGNLLNLRELDLRGGDGGGLTGPIPRELANLTNLHKLLLNGNGLEGEIPPELGDLVTETFIDGESTGYQMRLSFVNLAGNRLTGCVPSKLERVWKFHADIPFCE